MAANSDRSLSPLTSRPCNQSVRASENNPTTRRSFSGSNNTSFRPSGLNNPRKFVPNSPASSPVDFRRRSTTDSCLKNCEEKENDEKDNILKAPKMNNPAKNCKNFMSPTISAASKFSPSPRKKVLTERNDPLRTSISLSDGKAMFFSSNVWQDLEPKTENSFALDAAVSEGKKSACEGLPVCPKSTKRVTFALSDSHNVVESLSELVTTESGSMKLESSLEDKLSYSSVPNCIAPLDADPSTPPYDPKNNYLSPRPKFLHYKPNPRIEIFLNRETELEPDDFKKLEDSLMAEIMSETISDSDDTEESHGGDSPEGKLESVIPYDMVIGLNDTEVSSHAWGTNSEIKTEDAGKAESKDSVYADKVTITEEREVDPQAYDMVIGLNETEVSSHARGTNSEIKTEDTGKAESKDSVFAGKVTIKEEREVDPQAYESSKSLPVSTTVTDAVSDKSSDKKNEKKSWAFSRLMRFTLLLTFLISCASIYYLTHSPSFGKLVLTDLSLSDVSSFYQQSRLAASAKTNFGRLAIHANHLSVDLVSIISKLATDLGKGGKLVQLQFMNISDLQKDTWLEGCLLNYDLEKDELKENMEVKFDKDPVEDLGKDELKENMVVKIDNEIVEDLEVDELEDNTEADSEENFDKEFDQQEFFLETVYEELEKNMEAEINAFQVGEAHDGANSAENTDKEFDQQEFALQTEVLTPDPALLPELELVVGTEVAVGDPVLLPESKHLTCDENFSTGNHLAVILHQNSKLEAAVQDTLDAEGTTKFLSVDSNLGPAVPADVAFPIEVVQSSPRPALSPLQHSAPLNYHVIGIYSLLAAAMAVAFLVYKSNSNPNTVGFADKHTCITKKNTCSAFNENDHIPKETPPFSKNPQTEYDDDISESCPFEMSSFQKSAYYDEDFREVNEVQSIERRPKKLPKRDSLASSSGFSTGCPSYGSFTTFERIPIKTGNGEEEDIVTPVRRSSRIRKHQIITPQREDS